jgi:hypothetical protein
MKASLHPSPLREFRFEPDMDVKGLYAVPSFPAKALQEGAATALREYDRDTELWVQLHLGFLCRDVAGRQVGRQPGSWAWAELEQAMRFMGGLEDGQGQPVVLSTWCVCWPDKEGEAFVLGPCMNPGLRGTFWRVDPFGWMDEKLHCPVPGEEQVWRMRVGREYADTEPEAWTNAVA